VKRLCPVAWYGGKSSHLSWLLPIIDGIPHQTYVESFGGSAAVLLNKQISPVEVYNDLYGDVAHFFRILRDHGEELITALHLTPYSREEFSSSCGEKADVSDIERARRFFVRARQVTLGLAETATPGRWSYTKGPPRRGIAATVSRWLSAIEGLEEVVARLRLVQIENENGLDTIVRYDSQDTLHYVDPPYPSETRSGGRAYSHEYSAEAHARLLTLLSTVKGKVVLSSYDNARYTALLNGWTKRVLAPKNPAAARAVWVGGASERQEVVWLSPNTQA
jgi:DNA adenine methylase